MAIAATVAEKKDIKVKQVQFAWEGKDKSGKTVSGQMKAGGEAVVRASLRRQGVQVTKVKRQRLGRGKITDKDITLFT